MRPAKRIREGLAPNANPLNRLGTARRTPVALTGNPNEGKRHAAKLGHLDRTFAHLPRCPEDFTPRGQLDAVEYPRRDAIGRDISKRYGNVRIA